MIVRTKREKVAMSPTGTSEGPKKYYRSRKDRKLAGVCSGIGEYFGIDPMIVRLAWIFFTLAGGGGLLAYLIAWLVVPEAPQNPGEVMKNSSAVSK